MESMTGRLLVATPTLKDPNFDRTVVLLVAHESGGALGVVLNRATEVPVSDVLGTWGELAGEPAYLAPRDFRSLPSHRNTFPFDYDMLTGK